MIRSFLYFLKRPVHWLKTGLFKGFLGQVRFGFPNRQLKIIAITGTDGKTTTCSLICHLLNEAKIKTGLISTVAAKIGKQNIDIGLHVTSPDPFEMYALLRKMVKAKCQYAVIEMTSHGAYQFRDWGIKPEIAGLTNISHEHLDYHPDYLSYLSAKTLLLKKAKIVYLNKDDQSFYRVRQRLKLKQQDVDAYSMTDPLPKKIKEAINKRFPEPYNQANARLAVAIAVRLGLDSAVIARGIENFSGVGGRLQPLILGQKFELFIDFAHTPNAIDNVLGALKNRLKKNRQSGRLIALFGSAGKRDISKRPLMGQMATKHADYVILTADDPRNDNIWSIIHQIKGGIERDHSKIISIPDRYTAIKFAITQLAQPHDIIVLMGKGVEKSMAIGHQEVPWSDELVATQIIKETQLDKHS